MKKFFLCISICLLHSHFALGAVQIYTGIIGGDQFLTETNGSDIYNHESQFFVGHLGGALGAAYVATLGVIGLGLKGEIAWIGNSIDRKHSTSSDSKSYRYESQRGLVGFTFSLRPGPVAIDLDYYPTILNKVSYSDNKAQNPFGKEDNLKGRGIGLALAFSFFPPMRNFLMFRKLEYSSVDMNGAPLELPTELYSLLKFDEVVIGFGSEF